jgi:hypothetical protein
MQLQANHQNVEKLAKNGRDIAAISANLPHYADIFDCDCKTDL